MGEVHVDAGHLLPLGLDTLVINCSLFFSLACCLLRRRGAGSQRPLSFAHRRGASVERRFEVRAHAPERIATWLEVGMLRIDCLLKRLASCVVVEDFPHRHRSPENTCSRLGLRQLFLTGHVQCLGGFVPATCHLDHCGSELDSRLPARSAGVICGALVRARLFGKCLGFQ